MREPVYKWRNKKIQEQCQVFLKQSGLMGLPVRGSTPVREASIPPKDLTTSHQSSFLKVSSPLSVTTLGIKLPAHESWKTDHIETEALSLINNQMQEALGAI